MVAQAYQPAHFSVPIYQQQFPQANLENHDLSVTRPIFCNILEESCKSCFEKIGRGLLPPPPITPIWCLPSMDCNSGPKGILFLKVLLNFENHIYGQCFEDTPSIICLRVEIKLRFSTRKETAAKVNPSLFVWGERFTLRKKMLARFRHFKIRPL